MATMRESVSIRVERLQGFHEAQKNRRYGFLVRPLTLVLGWTVLIIGLITIPLPGQGWLTTFLGVGILSLEQRWAHRLLEWGVELYDRFFAWFASQSTRVRVLLIGLLIVVIWAVFGVGIYLVWRSNGLASFGWPHE